MDPITLLMGGGALLSLGSSVMGASSASKYAGTQQNIAGLEMQVNDQRKNAMELSARRQQMENLRNSQRARAMGLNAATNQGAQFGSGLQGGYGQESGQYEVNQLGITQNLQIGENLFGLDNQINQQKQLAAKYQGQQATYGAISGLGQQLMKSGPALGNMFGGFGSGTGTGTNYGSIGGSTSFMGRGGIW